ncbi:MAG: aldehyde ferredoxin oxidoreductase family protein [Lentisphaeria bacterium]|nr:aldehyde ferredoxin oxidoreductase family protein [Lentisphaeria bacterium]
MNYTNPEEQHVLRVDLTTGELRLEVIDVEDVRRFLGGRGIAAALLARAIDPPVDPLSAAAPLIFSMGTLTGTNAPMSGRSNVTFVSPATGLYCKANVGGHFGLYCRMNGIDFIVVHGASETPVTLSIGPLGAEIRDATSIWGDRVRATTRSLEKASDRPVSVACIGPAGEHGVLYASIMSSFYNATARGGGGAVMGSKRLKAIAVERPSGIIRVADSDGFQRIQREMREDLYADSMADSYYTYGTAASVDVMNETKTLPSYNFQRGSIDTIEQLTSQYWNETGLLKRRVGCASCIYSCHRFIRIDEGPYAGACSGGPEYETVSSLGSGPGVSDIGAVQRANELCNDLGLDTISAGGTIQWAMETFERGLLSPEQADGIDLQFGSEQAITELPRRIAYRQGIGDLLADGTRRAAKRIGGESWKWAVQARGLEQSRVETRGAMGYALAFAMNPRGPDHLHTECLAEFGMTPEMIGLIEKITGDAKYARPDITEKRPEIVRYHEDIYAVSDALGLCAFITTAAYGGTPQRCAELFEAFTGLSTSAQEIMLAGRRIITLERLINLRLGWTENAGDYAPWRLMNERQEDLSFANPILDVERMTGMVREYYGLHEWEEKTGVPTAAVVQRLELEEFAHAS